ncbi:MAG: tetratricopeptide repeat protein [Rhodanobacteraceae bacterium]|nr:MAG: tetratricopeptide repeat protein [Rhodanobacteraceae bacterium]
MPASNPTLVETMVAAWNAGQAERVIDLAAQASDIDAQDENVLALLGIAQQHAGRHPDAVKTFGRLSRLRPDVSAYLNNLGVACRHAGDLEASEQAHLKARALAPRDAEVHYNLGLLYIQQRHWRQAREALLDAVALSPQFIDARLQAAHACHVCGDVEGEEAMLEGAADWPPQPAEQALVLASTLSVLGQLDTALKVLSQARLPAEPAAGPLQLRIAAQRVALYERNNLLQRAQQELQQLPLDKLDALPADADQARIDGWRAHAVVAMREGRCGDAATLYQRALNVARGDDETRAGTVFGLAAAYDRQARYRDAWKALEVAHALQMDTARMAAPELLSPHGQPLPMVARSVDANAHAKWRPLPGPSAQQSPVFVIGFPRSGTTLLEQMLDAHPDFRSMDERGYVYQLTERMQAAGQRYPGDLATLTESDAEQLRAVYWRLVRHVLPDLGQHRLVDKNPLNMLCLPMILRLFPEARIILCLRHPCDVLLSCSMQPFRSPAFMVLCSSLERLARGYSDAFEQCFGHLSVFAPNVLTWRYETVVDDFEGYVARLGDYLAVADASPFAGFAAHARARRFISTPSYARVTQPVSNSAVGRWKHYREWFEPVLPILQPWIERFGYTL